MRPVPPPWFPVHGVAMLTVQCPRSGSPGVGAERVSTRLVPPVAVFGICRLNMFASHSPRLYTTTSAHSAVKDRPLCSCHCPFPFPSVHPGPLPGAPSICSHLILLSTLVACVRVVVLQLRSLVIFWGDSYGKRPFGRQSNVSKIA